MNKREKMKAQIIAHGENILAIFPNAKEKDPYKLSAKLFRLERKATALTTDECNTGKDNYVELCKVLTKVKLELFGKSPNNTGLYNAIFINGDPRGYALKIDDKYVRENNLKIATDWGGYGILAPDFNVD